MYYRGSVYVPKEGLADITALAAQAVSSWGREEGLCTVTALEKGIFVVVAEGRRQVLEDILDGFQYMIPPRADYKTGTPWEAAAQTMAALAGPARDLMVHKGKLCLAEGEKIFLVGPDRAGETAFLVKCL